MIKENYGGILLSVCQGALLTATLAIVVGSTVLIAIGGVKYSQIKLEGIIYANNLIEEIKGENLEDLEKTIPLAGFFTNDGEYIGGWIEVEKIEDFFVINVVLRYFWGGKERELVVVGYKYGGN
ncbi:hypothetical protein SAMN02745227_00455 [Anaerobranca californiensis DSM 14826]|jgi:hypothetical protein|uniref:Uncharacterized protein n=1 Tax=Anaerobranca californiensis DSM 14826 TaxID=1120989 RepID=A0A1M6LC91_9FIRM|nr:hypothetical protein [Anaerobranca californiensis]SHJ68789.1 hypothetical protein SAMN02745227_00455 [Anaerobranca californiensis DSM 14826]